MRNGRPGRDGRQIPVKDAGYAATARRRVQTKTVWVMSRLPSVAGAYRTRVYGTGVPASRGFS